MDEIREENSINEVEDKLVDEIERGVKESVNPKTEDESSSLETEQEERKKRRKVKLAVIIIVILFLLLVGYRIYANYFADGGDEAQALVNVKTDVVQRGDIYLESPVTAKISAKDEVAVVPMVAGKVTVLNVKVGDYVKQGEVLFKIDDTQIQATLVQAREGYELAKSSYERMTYLYNEGVISEHDYESIKSQYNTAAAGYNTAMESASYYTVTAPISGYVTAVEVSQGSIAAQSMAVAIADNSQLVINLKVAESLAGKINVGDSVEISVSSLGKSFEGSVTTASKIPSIGTVTYPVIIQVNDPNKELLVGMFAEVRIKSEQTEAAIIVPSEAVIVKGGEPIVVTLEGNMPKFNPVVTGIDNGEYSEILSGINVGDVIVVAGQHYVEEGKEVRIIE